jgi:poly(3-hydroxybutyrate) depolymerase
MNWYHIFPQPMLAVAKRLSDVGAGEKRFRRAERHLVKEACRFSDGCLAAIDTLDEWKQRREHYREALAWMLGLAPVPPRGNVEAEIPAVIQRESFSIEKLIFQSLPGLLVTANFYLPHNRQSPLPCVVYLNGHWPSEDGAKTGFQDRYLWYPAHGFALLVVDPLQFGEIPGIHGGTHRLNMWHWLSLGYTPAGVEVWNAMRAIDWLETRPEIDSSRIGMTGISGGGVVTQFTASLDDRVSVAAPSCSTYTIGTQAAKGLVSGQCDCTYYPNVYGLDFPVVLALIAPRPLLLMGGRKDPIFPAAGFRSAFRQAKRIYDLFDDNVTPGKGGIRLIESNRGHADPPETLKECRKWMTQWLGNSREFSDDEIGAISPPLEAPKILRCTSRPPRNALNYNVHESWIPIRAPKVQRCADEWAQRRSELLEILRSRIFHWFPKERPPFQEKRLIGSGGYAQSFTRFSQWEFETERGVSVSAEVLEPKCEQKVHRVLVWVRRPEDHVQFPDLDELLPLISKWAVVMLTPRFAGGPLSPSERSRIERTAALAGRTCAAMQIWDLLRTVEWVKERYRGSRCEISLFGRGDAAVVAMLAGVLDSGVGHVILADTPSTFRQTVPLLTILRDSDLPEIASLLAPRCLTFVPGIPESYVSVERVYDLLGVAKNLSAHLSVAECLLDTGVEAGFARVCPLC